MKTKLDMAHEYAMLHMMNPQYKDADDLEMVQWAFDYADAMQAAADERENKERPDVLLTKDKDGKCLHFHHEFGHKKCMDCGASLEEWQPDWSQAPEWATHFFCERDEDDQLNGYFAEDRRGISIDSDIQGFDGYGRVCSCKTFGYTGDWRNSLRKRPK